MSDYSFVIDSTFKPFSLQEMLVPFSAYKDAYEKAEETYVDLTTKSDTFKYLSKKLPKDSEARKIYEGYANDLKSQAEDLNTYGFTAATKRGVSNMRRRYSGEIGRLDKANTALEEEQKLRKTLNAQDSSRLYATDNLNIDDFLDGNNPNLYSISGNELYNRGAQIGKSYSTRIYKAGDAGSTLAGMYRDWVTKVGYSPESIAAFRKSMSAIPELQMAAEALLKEKGVTTNLTGANLERARESVINGIIDGSVYQEAHNPQRDLSVPTWAENAQNERQKEANALNREELNFKRESYYDGLKMQGFTKNKDGSITYNPENDKDLERQSKLATGKASGSTSGTDYTLADPVMIGAKTGKTYTTPNMKNTYGADIEDTAGAEAFDMGEEIKTHKKMTPQTRERIFSLIGGEQNYYKYEFYKIPAGKEYSNGTTDENIYIVKPSKSTTVKDLVSSGDSPGYSWNEQ